MPYRLHGKCVQTKKLGIWINLKCHETRAKALAHLRALYANVQDAKDR